LGGLDFAEFDLRAAQLGPNRPTVELGNYQLISTASGS
jgi:hypothetical protein